MAEWIKLVTTRYPMVDLVLFGEAILGWYAKRDGTKAYHRSIAETIPGETTHFASRLAQLYGIYLSFGMTELHQGDIFNSQLFINPDGEILAVHRKFHLMESGSVFTPGKVPVTVVNIKDIRIGIIICSDIQSQVVRKALKDQEVDIILGGLASPKDPNFLISGMIAKLFDAWIITANRYGNEDHYFYDGNMMISNPLGKIQLKSVGKEQILYDRLYFNLGETKWHYLARRIFVMGSTVPYLLKMIGLNLLIKRRD